MSQKNEKKLRRMIRKEYGDTLLKVARDRAKLIKGKPRWIPKFIWLAILSIFVKKQI